MGDDRGQNRIDQDDGKTDKQADDIYCFSGDEEIQDDSRYGKPNVIFEHDFGFGSVIQGLKDLSEVVTEPVKIDDADKTAQKNAEGKTEREEEKADEHQNAQHNPINPFKSLLEGVFFCEVHF